MRVIFLLKQKWPIICSFHLLDSDELIFLFVFSNREQCFLGVLEQPFFNYKLISSWCDFSPPFPEGQTIIWENNQQINLQRKKKIISLAPNCDIDGFVI